MGLRDDHETAVAAGTRASHVRCTHTKGNRVQECVLVRVADRMACIPIAPAENAVGKLAGGIAQAAAGLVTVRLGRTTIEVAHLETAEDLDAVVEGSNGFYLGPAWTYRTGLPVIGTMLVHGDEVITTRDRVPAEMLAKLTPGRAPRSARPVKIACGIGAAILAVATIAYLATGSLEVLLGIGFWGILVIATSLYAWKRASA
jgi:hypothetical protein